MNTRMVSVLSVWEGQATEDLECGCGSRADELECWVCGLQLCEECARIYWIDGYEVVLCPMCAPALNPRGDE